MSMTKKEKQLQAIERARRSASRRIERNVFLPDSRVVERERQRNRAIRAEISASHTAAALIAAEARGGKTKS